MRRAPGAVVLRVALALLSLPAAAQTQRDLDAAAGTAFAQADRRLNAVYKGLMDKISANGQARLREAQQSWLRFRDQECLFESLGTEGGSIHSMIVTQCRTRLTEQRVADLEHQLDCPEGDVSCGGQ